MSSRVKFSKISQMPAQPERNAIYFLKTTSNQMKIFVTTGDETPAPIEAEYGLDDYTYTNGTTDVSATGLSINYVREITTSSSSVSVNITDDGTANGTPIFNDLRLCHIVPLCIKDTTSNNEAPWAYIRSYDHTTHSVVFGIKRSNTGSILIGDTYLGNQDNDGSLVLRVQITGPKYSL